MNMEDTALAIFAPEWSREEDHDGGPVLTKRFGALKAEIYYNKEDGYFTAEIFSGKMQYAVPRISYNGSVCIPNELTALLLCRQAIERYVLHILEDLDTHGLLDRGSIDVLISNAIGTPEFQAQLNDICEPNTAARTQIMELAMMLAVDCVVRRDSPKERMDWFTRRLSNLRDEYAAKFAAMLADDNDTSQITVVGEDGGVGVTEVAP